MTVMVTAHFSIKPEAWDDTLAFLREALVDTRNFEGCEKLDTFLDAPNHEIFMVEYWAAPEDQQKYLGWREETGALAAFGEKMTGPPEFRTWEITDI